MKSGPGAVGKRLRKLPDISGKEKAAAPYLWSTLRAEAVCAGFGNKLLLLFSHPRCTGRMQGGNEMIV
jgi:hypothetical protein